MTHPSRNKPMPVMTYCSKYDLNDQRGGQI